MNTTVSISTVIALYDSYLLTINSVLVIFAILVSLFAIFGWLGLKKYLKGIIKDEINESMNSDDIRSQIEEVVEQRVKEEGDQVFKDTQQTRELESYEK